MYSVFREEKLISLLALLLVCWPLLVYGNKECIFNHTPTDWQNTPDACSLCGGHYVPFYSPIPNFNQSTQLPVDIDFEQGDMVWVGVSELHQAKLIQGLRWWEANHITLNKNEQHWNVLAKGDLVFHQPNMSVWADTAFYNNENGYVRLHCADFRWYPRHARAKSETIEMPSQEEIILHESTFTTCSPNQNSWQLKAEKITLYPKQGRAKAKNIYLTSHDVPLFYWPYLNYPIDNKRQSGFLFPAYNSSSQSGIGLSVPYYFNLAPNYDWTLTAKAYTKRGAGANSNFRYLTELMDGAFYVDYLPNDSAYQRFRTETLADIPTGYTALDPRILGIRDHRYRLGMGLEHHLKLGNAWFFDVNYHRVSDDNFFVDLGNDIHTTSTLQLPQRAELRFLGQNWSHQLRVEEYQVLQPFKGAIVAEIYRRQPQWAFTADYPAFWQSTYFNLTGELTRFTHPGDVIALISKVEGARFYAQPSFHRPFRAAWGELIPTVYLDALTYDLQTPAGLNIPINNHPSRVVPIYTMDSKIFFERSLIWGEHSFVQTLTPRLFYTYIPYRNQRDFPNFDSGVIQFSYAQLFRYNRFSGKDRLNEANQVSLSLTSSLLSQDASFEWFRIGVGEILYFTSEKVFLCDAASPLELCQSYNEPRLSRKHSNLLSEVVFSTPHTWQWGAFIEWGLKQDLIQQASVFLQTKLYQRYLFNMNYYFTRRDPKTLDATQLTSGTLNQGDISLFMPLNQNFNVLTRFHYDFKFNQFVELLGGIEYDSCCFATQFVVSRYRQLGNAVLGREYANQFMLQFIFKGLSNLEINQAEQKLKQKIPGFEPLANRVALPALGAAKRQ